MLTSSDTGSLQAWLRTPPACINPLVMESGGWAYLRFVSHLQVCLMTVLQLTVLTSQHSAAVTQMPTACYT